MPRLTYQQKEARLAVHELRGVEIFATGTWNGRKFTDADLDDIVRSFDFFELSGRVPFKLGHNFEQPVTDGQPALGWVRRIYRAGAKLLADFFDIPTIVYDAIRTGRYKFVSVELLRDVQADTRVVPLVLDAVALLGADVPAVGNLRDLQALTLSRLRGTERLAFTQAFTNVESSNRMTDTPPSAAETELANMRAQLARMQADLARSNSERDAANTQATANHERFSRLEADTRAAKIKAHRESIKELLETAVRKKEILPAARERFTRRFKIESDDVESIPLSDVESYIKENPNPFLKTASATIGGDPDEIPSGGLPDKELMARSRKVCRERGWNPENWEHLQRAGVAVLRADPQLAQRYRDLPDDHADGMYAAQS